METTDSLPEQHLLRGWRSVMFAPVGDGQRRQRGSDGVRLAVSVLAVVCCVFVIRFNSRLDQAIVQVIYPPPRSITWLVTVVYQAGSYGVVTVLVALALITRRWEIARRRHRRGLHPAPVLFVPAAQLGLGHPGLDAEEGVSVSTAAQAGTRDARAGQDD